MCKTVDMVLARMQGVLGLGESIERLNKYWV